MVSSVDRSGIQSRKMKTDEREKVTYVHISTVKFSKVTSSIRPESIYNSNRLGSIIRMTVKIGSKKTTRNNRVQENHFHVSEIPFFFFLYFRSVPFLSAPDNLTLPIFTC